MTTRAATSLVLKLIGVFILVQTIGSLVASLGGLTIFEGAGDKALRVVMVFLLIPVAYVLGCFWFIKKSDFFAGKLVHEDQTVQGVTYPTIREIQAIAYSCIGLIVLVNTLPELTQMLSYSILLPTFYSGRFNAQLLDTSYSLMASLTVRIIVGLYLFCWPGGLVALWHKLQEGRGMVNK